MPVETTLLQETYMHLAKYISHDHVGTRCISYMEFTDIEFRQWTRNFQVDCFGNSLKMFSRQNACLESVNLVPLRDICDDLKDLQFDITDHLSDVENFDSF